jgi:hypothetical protein
MEVWAMASASRSSVPPNWDLLDVKVDAVIAECGGAREAVRALIDTTERLRAESAEVRSLMSWGYARWLARTAPE